VPKHKNMMIALEQNMFGGSVRVKMMMLGSIKHKNVTIGSLRTQNHG